MFCLKNFGSVISFLNSFSLPGGSVAATLAFLLSGLVVALKALLLRDRHQGLLMLHLAGLSVRVE